MLELKDTIEMMTSDDYKERFKAEYHQTKIRRDKLIKMFEQLLAGTLPFTPKCPARILRKQLFFMERYLYMLEVRAEIEGIDLEADHENH